MLEADENGDGEKKQYQGFAIDLLKEIAKKLKFNYTVYIVKDGTYGAPNDKTGDWNGMVRELIEKVSLSNSLFIFSAHLFRNSQIQNSSSDVTEKTTAFVAFDLNC